MSAKKAPAKRTTKRASSAADPGSATLLRKHALKLPETAEAPHFDMPSFRVAGKIFATARVNERKAMLKLPRDLQSALCAAHAGAVEPVPGTWGERGATFVFIDKVPESLFADLVASAWANAAPKSVRAAHGSRVRKG
jgi:hypothetical protein